jgi:uncharacterized OsmC-like protein
METQIDSQSKRASSNDNVINGLDTVALTAAVAAIAENPALAPMVFRAKTAWQGGLASRTQISSFDLAGQTIERVHTILCDEPTEILGGNTAPNPQDLLLAALNACMTVGFVAGATARGIQLKSLSVESSLRLDLRGAFGLDKSIPPGAETIRYKIEVSGNATPAQFAEIHQEAMQNSPNRWHLSQPIKLEAELVVR